MRKRMISAKRCTTFSGIRGSFRQAAKRSAIASRRSISRKANKPPSEDSRPPPKRAMTALPCTGDRPGRNGVASTMAGAAPVDRGVEALNPNPTANQYLGLHPPALTHNSGWMGVTGRPTEEVVAAVAAPHVMRSEMESGLACSKHHRGTTMQHYAGIEKAPACASSTRRGGSCARPRWPANLRC